MLKGFYHIWAWWPSWSSDVIVSSDFHFLVPESFHTKFGSDRHSSLKFCMYTTLGQGQEMTLTFNTHISSYTRGDPEVIGLLL